MKVGVIGAGYWGRKHVDEYTQLGCRVVVSDLRNENLEFCKLNFGAEVVSDYNEILNDNEINFVSICVPNSLHHKIALEAFHKNKNVLLEKPIALNSKDADEIIQVSKEKKLVLLIGHIFRFNQSIKTIKELLKQKQLGKIHTVNFSWTNFEPLFPDRDILFDLGVHPIDILYDIFGGTPSDIFCVGKGFRQKKPEFATINYHIKEPDFKNDIFVNIQLSWLNPIRERKMIIVGSEKTAVVECVMQKIHLINNVSQVQEDVSVLPNNTIRDELQYFTSNTKNESIDDSKPSGDVGKKIVEIIEAAYTSLNDKKISQIT